MYRDILAEIAEERVRKRPGRRNLRCKKRRGSPFPAPPPSGSRALPKTMGLAMLALK